MGAPLETSKEMVIFYTLIWVGAYKCSMYHPPSHLTYILLISFLIFNCFIKTLSFSPILLKISHPIAYIPYLNPTVQHDQVLSPKSGLVWGFGKAGRSYHWPPAFIIYCFCYICCCLQWHFVRILFSKYSGSGVLC